MDAHDLFNPKAKPTGKSTDPGAKQGLFSKKMPLPTGPSFSQVSTEVNNVSRRLRTLEERYINLRKKTQLTEQNMITSNKKMLNKIRDTFDEINEIRNDIKKIRDQMDVMNSELHDCANRNDLMTLEKYVSYWQPMGFLTEKEAKQLIENFK